MYRCIALIDQQALLHNISYLQDLSGTARTIVMVKANAYGHGLKEIASILKEKPLISFGVAAIDEAVILRHAGANNQILLFDGGASGKDSNALIDYDIIPMISSEHSLLLLDQCLRKRHQRVLKKIHLKIDTGFTRLGLDYRAILTGKYDEFICRLQNSRTITLAGIATHFCNADAQNDSFTDVQISNFRQCLHHFSKLNVTYDYVHMGNSAAILRKKSYLDIILKDQLMIRPGLASYGVNPLCEDGVAVKLKPVMSIKAQIIALKTVDIGQGIGYGHTFIALDKRIIAIVAIGYGDGLRRSLSNRAYFLCHGERAPIVGTISMDSCAIDITHVIKKYGEYAVKHGDFVTVLGKDGDENIDAKLFAKLDDTVPYEILTSIAERLRRHVV
jgi:alanine racemase